VEGATLVILMFGAGNFFGTLIGGIGSSHIYERYGRRYPALLSALAAIFGCIPFWGMINFNFDPNERKGIVILGSISMLAGILSGITGPIVKSTLQNVTMPQMRGTAFALHTTFDDLGRGLGPAFVAWMIEKMGSRRRAFNVGAGGWMVCGLLNGLLFCTVNVDEERMRLGVAQLVVANEPNSSNQRDIEGGDLL
jgi:MFS family permease